MTIPIAARFEDAEVLALDQLVADGLAASWSDAIRLAVAQLHERRRRSKVGRAIADAYRSVPPTDEDDASAPANANALTERSRGSAG